ncbi:MAG TPA: hypothetical protein VGK24_10250 [Candidatus Angelobacter sp.]|jgi:hypothetical protein
MKERETNVIAESSSPQPKAEVTRRQIGILDAIRELNPILLVMLVLMIIFPFIAGHLPQGIQTYLDALYK